MKRMKTFRPYWSRGRVPTPAGYLVVLAGAGASFLAYGVALIAGLEVPAELRRPAAWVFLAIGGVVSFVLGWRLRRMGLPLSQKED